MTFQEIYTNEKEKAGGSMPTAFLAEIAEAAMVSSNTAYQWATGWRNPSKAAAHLVANHLGIPADELFPRDVRSMAGAVMLIAGLLLAVCTMDGSSFEIPVRLAGVGMVGTGAWLRRLFDWQKGGRP